MKKTLVRTPKLRLSAKSLTPRARLGGGLALLGLVAAVGLASSRPAHTAGGPIAVNVANTVPTVDVDNAARQPVADLLVLDVPDYSLSTFTVPAGKRLVIQQISAFTASNTAQETVLYATVSGREETFSIPFTVTSGGEQYGGGPVTLYADPGTTLSFGVNDTRLAITYVEFEGYYVNVP